MLYQYIDYCEISLKIKNFGLYNTVKIPFLFSDRPISVSSTCNDLAVTALSNAAWVPESSLASIVLQTSFQLYRSIVFYSFFVERFRTIIKLSGCYRMPREARVTASERAVTERDGNGTGTITKPKRCLHCIKTIEDN